MVAPSGRPAGVNSARDREYRALFRRYRENGDAAAREALVERFLPLARKLAARYRRGPRTARRPRAGRRFRPAEGDRPLRPCPRRAFSSFAVPTILGELRRHFRDTGWAIKVPRDLQELAVRLDGTIDELHATLGRAPTAAEIAERLNTTPEQVLEARAAAAAHHAESLDSRRADRDGRRATLSDVIGAHDVGWTLPRRPRRLEHLLRRLTDRDREILRLRFAEDLTQSEIGERLGISQMHVSRRIRQSLEQLRELAETEDEPLALGAVAA